MPEELGRGKGKGVGGPAQGDGGADFCVCLKCGTKVKHQKGTPCSSMTCPNCGQPMRGE